MYEYMKVRYLKQAEGGEEGFPEFTYAEIENEDRLESQVLANSFILLL